MSLRRSCLIVLVALVVALPAMAGQKKNEKADESGDKQLELKACGAKEKEVNYDADTDKKNHPVGDQTTDRALIYVLRPTMMGNKIQTKVAVDGEWKGVTRGNNYFFLTLPPGEHFFCSQAENRSVLSLKVEGGKTYYLQQHIRMGLMKARNELTVMSDDEARKKLSELHPSTWKTK